VEETCGHVGNLNRNGAVASQLQIWSLLPGCCQQTARPIFSGMTGFENKNCAGKAVPVPISTAYNDDMDSRTAYLSNWGERAPTPYGVYSSPLHNISCRRAKSSDHVKTAATSFWLLCCSAIGQKTLLSMLCLGPSCMASLIWAVRKLLVWGNGKCLRMCNCGLTTIESVPVP